jgi:tRNA-dihydrouridine synthase
VLGNGDIWECWDALRMMRQTGCAGVIVGRGCLGKPWLFRDLAAVFAGEQPPPAPTFGEMVPVIIEHAQRLTDWFGEKRAGMMMRKQLSWYTKGLAGGATVRSRLSQIRTVADVEREIQAIAPDARLPVTSLRLARGKSGGTQKVALPEGYLDDLEDDTPPVAAAGVASDGG